MNINIENIYTIFLKHPHISTDTRNIKPDSLFFALKGSNFNGNEFAEEALRKGAAYAIIDQVETRHALSPQLKEKIILVDDVLISLQQLAKHHRQQFNIPVIGITGTNGKTTTKELVNVVLSRKYKITATTGNLNNHIGVPLTLLTINQDTEIAIIEMGANHPGEIAELCQISLPDYGIITNIGKAHIEGFGSFENIISTKKALYDSVIGRGGTLFVNGDDQLLMNFSFKSKRFLYGNIEGSVCTGKVIDNNPFLNINCTLINNHTTYDLRLTTNLIGTYNFENILAAICIGNYFEISAYNIIKALEDYKPSGYRSQFIDTGRNKIIMDAYNANPSSMELAINNFADLSHSTPNSQLPTQKVAIIGDMFELGKDTEFEHKKIIELLETQKFEMIFLIGYEFTKAFEKLNLNNYQLSTINYQLFKDSESASEYVKNNPITSKTILIKGSRGIRLEKILENL